MSNEPTLASVDKYGRLYLPKDFAENLSWLGTAKQHAAWIYVIEPGRYRLLSEADVERSATLKRVIQRITEAPDPDEDDDPFEAQDSASAAVVGLVLRVKLLHTKGVGWRLQIPRNSYPFASQAGHSGFYVLFSQGYLELWTLESLNHAMHEAPEKAGA